MYFCRHNLVLSLGEGNTTLQLGARAMRILMILVIITAGLIPHAGAQILQKSVISSGAVSSTNGVITVVGTVGQTITGMVATPTTSAYQGFWFTASAISEQPPEKSPQPILNITPHPVTSVSTLHYTNTCAGIVRMDLHTLEGKHVQTLYNGMAVTGELTTTIESQELASGLYLVACTTNCGTTSSLLVVRH